VTKHVGGKKLKKNKAKKKKNLEVKSRLDEKGAKRRQRKEMTAAAGSCPRSFFIWKTCSTKLRAPLIHLFATQKCSPCRFSFEEEKKQRKLTTNSQLM